MSRHTLYVILVSVILFLFILIFAFFILIPKGKEYRLARLDFKKELHEYDKYETFHAQTLDSLKNLQGQNRHIINAFRTPFHPKRFEKLNRVYFSSLQLSKISRTKDEEGFAVYEVNTTSKISTPKNFYNFLDAVNKSDWIIGVNFPINFKREGQMIKSSFTMKVYANKPDTSSSASRSSKR